MKYLRIKKQPNVAHVSAIIFLTATLLATTANASTADEKGFEIAARSDRSDAGFGDTVVELKMVLRNATGKETTRELSLRTLEKPNEQVGDKSLIVFSNPPDIGGTALLSYAQILKADDQWLYLPALKRVKRISSANKSGPFVGSEFAFEDFTSQELNKYSYNYLRSEACGELSCEVIERYPRYKNSGYSKQIGWIDQTDYQVRKIEFYDRRGDLLKTLTVDQYRQYDNRYWRPHLLNMVNHQTKKSTDLIYSDFHFNTGLSKQDFNKTGLKRIR
jgi:outer membrane lipoprotein-sorting protein